MALACSRPYLHVQRVLTPTNFGLSWDKWKDNGDKSGIGAIEKSIFYAAGFAFALTGLGLAATLGGRLFGLAFGSVGISSDTSSSFTAALTLIMGMLLEVITVPFPSLPDNGAFTGSASGHCSLCYWGDLQH